MLQVRRIADNEIFNVLEFYLDFVKLQYTDNNFFFVVTIGEYSKFYIELA